MIIISKMGEGIPEISSNMVRCLGVAKGRIGPLEASVDADVTVYRDGSRTVGCPIIDQVTGLCRAPDKVPYMPSLAMRGYSKCAYLFPAQSNIYENGGTIYYDLSGSEESDVKIACNTPYGKLVLNLERLLIEESPFVKPGIKVKITPLETRLLNHFMQFQGRSLSREYILNIINRGNLVFTSNDADVNIGRLRKKLQDDELKLIRTLRTIGYSLPKEDDE